MKASHPAPQGIATGLPGPETCLRRDVYRFDREKLDSDSDPQHLWGRLLVCGQARIRRLSAIGSRSIESTTSQSKSSSASTHIKVPRYCTVLRRERDDGFVRATRGRVRNAEADEELELAEMRGRCESCARQGWSRDPESLRLQHQDNKTTTCTTVYPDLGSYKKPGTGADIVRILDNRSVE